MAPACRRILCLIAFLLPAAAHAVIYAVALGADAFEKGGELFRLDQPGARATSVARFRLNGEPVSLRGIAVHPRTRMFYGITAAGRSTGAPSLVTFEASTGRVTLVGPLRHEASDLNFDASGTLYVWLPQESKLAIVDLGTGEARPLEMSGLGTTLGGGFAIRGDGNALLSATSAAGTLDHVDLRTGTVTAGPALHNAPFSGAIVAMDFAPDRGLFGVNTSAGPPSPAALVRIDTDSGSVTEAGPLPTGTTAIAFGLREDAQRYMIAVPEYFIVVLAVAILASLVAAGAIGYRLGSRDRSS